jgi:hypothetical protein
MAREVPNVIDNLDQLRPGKSQSSLDTSGIPLHQLLAPIHRNKSLNLQLPA